MEQTTTKQRIREFISYERISVSDFCRSIGVSVSFVSSMRRSIQPDKVDSIALKYPHLNIGWLMSGKGEMIKEVAKTQNEQTPDKGGDEKGIKIAMLQERIDELKKEVADLTRQNAVLDYLIEKQKEDKTLKHSEN